MDVFSILGSRLRGNDGGAAGMTNGGRAYPSPPSIPRSCVGALGFAGSRPFRFAKGAGLMLDGVAYGAVGSHGDHV